MCLFENKWINKEKKPKGLQFKLLFKFRKEREKKIFPKRVPCWSNIFIFYNPQSLLHESQAFILLYLYIFLHSYRKTFEFKFCMFSNTSGKVLDKATNLIYMLLNFIERFHIYNVFQNKLIHRLIFYLILSLRSLRLTVIFFYNAIETKEILKYVYIYACF